MTDGINMKCLDFLMLVYFPPFWNEIERGLNVSKKLTVEVSSLMRVEYYLMCLICCIALLSYYGGKGKAGFVKCELLKWRLCRFTWGVSKYRSCEECVFLSKLANLMILWMFSPSRVIFE